MTESEQAVGPGDPFGKLWADLFTHMGTAVKSVPGMPAPNWPDESVRQMQRSFFDALARYFDDYMRSPAFLNTLKQTMDQSLAFKQQVDRFLTDAQRSMQGSTQADVQDVAGLLRNMESRMLARLEDLEARIDAAQPRGTQKQEPPADRQKGKGPGGRK